ncbi:hypothetical protein PQR05_17400 [Paraburkholderia sediminicola]
MYPKTISIRESKYKTTNRKNTVAMPVAVAVAVAVAGYDTERSAGTNT